MATLVLGTVGRVFGGPVGGIIGTAVGGFVDRAVLGGDNGGRMASLTVQSAAYGEAIPVVSGRMRVAGNLIWTDGIAETAGAGGKRNGGASSAAYVYTASFAVGLGEGPIAAIGRIWADGRLIRGADGAFLTPTIMRLHGGSEGQAVDPLIAAAEGPAGTPAYRGIAYVVFEDLPLVDFGNRIPNLTFEVIADLTPVDIGTAIGTVATAEGRPQARVSGDFPAITGHFAGGDGRIANTLARLVTLAGGAVVIGAGIEIVAGQREDRIIDVGDRGTRTAGTGTDREAERRSGGETQVDIVEIGYFDVDRDYQMGVQRASRGVGGVTERQTIGAAMAASQAKAMAEAALARAQAARVRTTVRLPWRYLPLQPGMTVRTAGDVTSWRVRQMRFEGFVVYLDLERSERGAPLALPATSGRALAFQDAAPGPTVLAAIDPPLLPGEELSASRLWVAAAGAVPGWRGTAVEASLDGGSSYAVIGEIRRGSAIGTTLGPLPDGTTAGWDRFSSVDVVLLSDRAWLESRPENAVLAGANLALIGDELVQFASAEAIAPLTFRLSGLLRGRRGTESRTTGHDAGERFVLIDGAAMLRCALPAEALGSEVKLRPVGGGDWLATPVTASVSGMAARPLSPVHLRLAAHGGDLVATWTRRSREGFGWVDFVDAPLGEAAELYRIEIWRGDSLVRKTDMATASFVYTAAMQAVDGGTAGARITVCQLSAQVGPGEPATAELLPEIVGEPA